MKPDRAIAFILGISLAVVLLLGLWLLHSGARDTAAPDTAPTAPPTPAPSMPPTATPGIIAAAPAAAHGYRLAGTVVGDMTYAIIEDPRGVNHLYRPGQTVPGLGQITAIDADQITLAGNDGTFALQIAPAPSNTPTTLRAEPTGMHPAPPVTPAQRPTRDRSVSESSP